MMFLYPEIFFVICSFFIYLYCKSSIFNLKSNESLFTLNNFSFKVKSLEITNNFKRLINLLIFLSLLGFTVLINSLSFMYYDYKVYFFDSEFSVSNTELFFKILLYVLFCFCLLLFFNVPSYTKFKNYILSIENYQVFSYIYSCEFLLLIAFFCIAGCFFISAENFFLLFLSKECQTLVLCFLIVYCNTKSAARSALYFFFQAAFYSFLFLLGMSIIYFDINTLNFSQILDYLLLFKINDLEIFWLKIGFLSILFSFGFKLGVPPFNFWVLNIFSIMPQIVIFVVSLLSKVVVFTFFFKVNYLLYFVFEFDFNFFALMGSFSLLYSSVAGLIESNLFRIFAFSSFNHLGLLLLGMSFNNLIGMFVVFFYLLIYLMNSLFFLISTLFKKNMKNIYSFAYHYHVDPWFCIVFSVVLFSMSGIPPFIGFFSKMFVGLLLYNYAVFVNSWYYLFFFVFLVTSILVVILYLRIIRMFFFGGYKYLKFYYYSFPISKKNFENMFLLYFFLIMSVVVVISPSWVLGVLFDFFYHVY